MRNGHQSFEKGSGTNESMKLTYAEVGGRNGDKPNPDPKLNASKPTPKPHSKMLLQIRLYLVLGFTESLDCCNRGMHSDTSMRQGGPG